MRINILVFLMVTAAYAKKPKINNKEDVAEIVRQDYELNLDGSYRYGYETSNGIVAEQSGFLKRAPNGKLSQEVDGQAVYTAPNKKIISLTYHAGVEGYRPEGDHLPKSPPTPRIVKELVEYLATKPPSTDGKPQIIAPKPKPNGSGSGPNKPPRGHDSKPRPSKRPSRPSSNGPEITRRKPSRKPNKQHRSNH